MSQVEVPSSDRFSISKKQNGCYVFSKEQLIAIFAIIEKSVGKKPTVTLDLSDDRSITSEDMDQLLNDPFIESSSVASISYGIYGYDKPNRVSIRLRYTESIEPITYEIFGERSFCLSLEQSLISIFGAARKWYGPLNIYNNPGIIQMLIVFPLSALVAFVIYVPFYMRDKTSSPWVFFVAFVLMVFVIPSSLGKIIPKIVFNFGRGKIIRHRMLWPINWFISAVVLTLIGAYFRGEITMFFTWVFSQNHPQP